MNQIIEDDKKVYDYYCNKINLGTTLKSDHLTLALYTICSLNNNNDLLFKLLDEQVMDDFTLYLTKRSILHNLIESNKPIHVISCQFHEYCPDCRKGTTDTSLVNTYCHTCKMCQDLRKTREKYIATKTLGLYLNTLKVQDKKLVLLNDKITNNVDDNVKNYIETKDKYFEVFITNKNIEDLKHLKYVFIYILCRKKAVELFPGEDDYNYATTFPVSCAAYCIENNKTLHGLLRYTNDNNSWVNYKKLLNLTNNKQVNITLNKINFYNNVKHCIDKNKITEIYNAIEKEEHFGSTLDDFCEDTL